MPQDMLSLENNWRTAWLERSIERLEERLKKGETEVVLHIQEFQHVLVQLLATHKHCDRLEEVLMSYAKYAFPVQQVLKPAMFGSDRIPLKDIATGRFGSGKSNLSNIPKEQFTAHVFGQRCSWGVGKNASTYRICVRCGRSDVYLNHIDNTNCLS